MTPAAYKIAMVRRKAAAAGLTVDEFVRRSEDEAERVRRINELVLNRAAQWEVLGRRIFQRGGTLTHWSVR